MQVRGVLCAAVAMVGGLALVAGVAAERPLSSTVRPDARLTTGSLTFGARASHRGVTAISADYVVTCAQVSGGAAKCWGANGLGELGDGTTNGPETCGSPINPCSTVPVDVSGLSSGVVAIDVGGHHSCVVLRHGVGDCWGANYEGQLGNGTTTDSSTPVPVSGLSRAVAVSAGGDHSCVLLRGGAVECWGRNFSGELGNGTTTDSSTPVPVSGLSSGVASITSGGQHMCAIVNARGGGGAGAVKCWGQNGVGQLGDGTTTGPQTCGTSNPCSTVPVDVSGLSSGVVAIAGGSQFTCALTAGGAVECWGQGFYGQLGNGGNADSSTPVPVSGLSSGVVAIGAGGAHACAVLQGGAVKCWGYNGYGQLGDGTTTGPQLCGGFAPCSTVPVDVSGLPAGAVGLTGGFNHTCALLSTAAAACWGSNGFGQLGNGTTTDSSTPVLVTGL